MKFLILFTIVLVFSFSFTACDSKEEQDHEISFPIQLSVDDSDFVLTYFNHCDPAEFFSEILKQDWNGKVPQSVTLSHLQELTAKELLVLSSLSDRDDTLIIIDWPKSYSPLYRWEDGMITLPIIRFIPETGEYYHSKLYMGRKNELNGWWVIMEANTE